jgi:hypothetical protein
MLNPPFPELDDLLHIMGDAGRHLAAGEAGTGLSVDEIRAICTTFSVKQDIY